MREGREGRERGRERERGKEIEGERDDFIVVVGCSHTSTGKKSSV